MLYKTTTDPIRVDESFVSIAFSASIDAILLTPYNKSSGE